ncbi:hypothetical protein E0L93_08815 [Rubrobacter taiwanensis]|jgi:hypothetical protein|uniref:Uncharacterized protein n=1 Tax=Rubrobacter taiwanensis TaxID=185139 RepID=A0A4R1BHT2_9ACTN|nr:hypothetical protein [Rubrobacter taiwanensis]TCJ16813.1 hypothetical protein E0L93_08815 [Rubrobacter taiwanensis]
MKSIGAILLGMLLSAIIGVLLISGIFGPVFATFFETATARQLSFPAGLFIFGVAFYFGGMLASYRAPHRRVLHGTLVSVASFGVSLVVNLGVVAFSSPAEDPLAGFRSAGIAAFTALLVLVSFGASFYGARRGEELYHYNRQFARRGH